MDALSKAFLKQDLDWNDAVWVQNVDDRNLQVFIESDKVQIVPLVYIMMQFFLKWLIIILRI